MGDRVEDRIEKVDHTLKRKLSSITVNNCEENDSDIGHEEKTCECSKSDRGGNQDASPVCEIKSDHSKTKKIKLSNDNGNDNDNDNDDDCSNNDSDQKTESRHDVKKLSISNVNHLSDIENHILHLGIVKSENRYEPNTNFCAVCEELHDSEKEGKLFCYSCGMCEICEELIHCHCGSCWSKNDRGDVESVSNSSKKDDVRDKKEEKSDCDVRHHDYSDEWGFDPKEHEGHCEYLTLCGNCVSGHSGLGCMF